MGNRTSHRSERFYALVNSKGFFPNVSFLSIRSSDPVDLGGRSTRKKHPGQEKEVGRTIGISRSTNTYRPAQMLLSLSTEEVSLCLPLSIRSWPFQGSAKTGNNSQRAEWRTQVSEAKQLTEKQKPKIRFKIPFKAGIPPGRNGLQHPQKQGCLSLRGKAGWAVPSGHRRFTPPSTYHHY